MLAVLLALTLAGVDSLAVLMAFLLVGFSFMGLVIPTTMVMALDEHGPIAGMAAALGGTLQMLTGGAMIVVASLAFNGTVLPMVAIMTACAFGALALTLALRRKAGAEAPEDGAEPGGRRGGGGGVEAAVGNGDVAAGIGRARGASMVRNEGDSAPAFRRDIGNRLGKGPSVAGRILDDVLPFAEGKVGRIAYDPCSVVAGAGAMRASVLDTHHDGVRRAFTRGRAAIASGVRDDHGAVAEAKLGAVVLADPDPFDKAKGGAEPANRRLHVRIGQNRYDRHIRD